MKKPLCQALFRKHEGHNPMEEPEKITTLCNKYDAALFAFGSSSKKRPSRLVLGRIFDSEILDMQEFDVSETSSFLPKAQLPVLGSKGMVVFQGAGWDSCEGMGRCKSMLLDFFRGPAPERVSLNHLETVVVMTCVERGMSVGAGGALSEKAARQKAEKAVLAGMGEQSPVEQERSSSAAVGGEKTKPKNDQPVRYVDMSSTSASKSSAPDMSGKNHAKTPTASPYKIVFRHYRIKMSKTAGGSAKKPELALSELGPRFTLQLDREQQADKERMKQALRYPDGAAKKKVKNVQTNALGMKLGRLHLGRQDFDKVWSVHMGAGTGSKKGGVKKSGGKDKNAAGPAGEEEGGPGEKEGKVAVAGAAGGAAGVKDE